MNNKYKLTLRAAYFSLVTQAITATFAPLLFLKFHNEFGLSLGKVALIPTVTFVAQLIVDFLCAKFVDRIGYRKAAIISEIAAGAGLAGLAVLPNLFANPFIGIMICVIVYSFGSGLLEVLANPIVEACPFENMDAVISKLHSGFSWGAVATILLSTIFFAIFGIDNWRIVAALWAIVPLYNIYNFIVCPIEPLVEEGHEVGMKNLFKIPVFWICFMAMFSAGVCELAVEQWASAYTESALGVTKTIGDIAGPCMFAVAMALVRTFYGKYGHKIDLTKFMILSGVLCLISYLMLSLSKSAVVGLLGCILCGFSVAIMWPGTISISSASIPLGGTALFGLLAMAGDAGASAGPAIVGVVSEKAGDNLRAGLLACSIFPVILIVTVIVLKKAADKKKN